MALSNNPTPNELVKAVKDVEQDKEYLPLLNKTEYKAFAFIDQFVTTSMDYFLPTEISMFDCSKLNDASLEVGDKILVFAKLYTTNADISDYNYVKTRIYLSTITGIYPIVQMFDVQSVLFNINNTSGRNLYRTMAFRDEIPTYTFDTTPTENSTNPVTSGGVYNALAHGKVRIYQNQGTGNLSKSVTIDASINPTMIMFEAKTSGGTVVIKTMPYELAKGWNYNLFIHDNRDCYLTASNFNLTESVSGNSKTITITYTTANQGGFTSNSQGCWLIW